MSQGRNRPAARHECQSLVAGADPVAVTQANRGSQEQVGRCHSCDGTGLAPRFGVNYGAQTWKLTLHHRSIGEG
jgi:hypothetical protein